MRSMKFLKSFEMLPLRVDGMSRYHSDRGKEASNWDKISCISSSQFFSEGFVGFGGCCALHNRHNITALFINRFISESPHPVTQRNNHSQSELRKWPLNGTFGHCVTHESVNTTRSNLRCIHLIQRTAILCDCHYGACRYGHRGAEGPSCKAGRLPTVKSTHSMWLPQLCIRTLSAVLLTVIQLIIVRENLSL
jgi:hypothetical protein